MSGLLLAMFSKFIDRAVSAEGLKLTGEKVFSR